MLKRLAVYILLCLLFAACSGSPLSCATKNTITCIYTSWAAGRNPSGRVFGDDLPAEYCTHAVYAYTSFYENKIFTMNPQLDDNALGQIGNIAKFVSLKQRNPGLKTLIGIGGWNNGGWLFSQMVSQPERRQMFIQSLIDFCIARDLEGVFIDWLYPGVGVRGGAPEDYANFASLLTEMRTAFDAPSQIAVRKLFIGVTVSASPAHVENYDAVQLNNAADLVYVISYDLAGYWNGTINHPSPLFSQEGLSVDMAVQIWLDAGVSAGKLVIGIPTFARTYKAPNGTDALDAYGSTFSGDGNRGPISQAPGFLYYSETCAALQYKGYTVTRDEVMKVPYATLGDQLIMYEDETSIKEKANYANTLGLAGAYLFSVDQDDAKGFCGDPYPLTRALASVFQPRAKSLSGRMSVNGAEQMRCVSSSKDCKEKVRCLQYPQPEALLNVTDICGPNITCVDPLSTVECPFPQNVIKRSVFESKEAIFVGSQSGNMNAVQCRDSAINSAGQQDGTFYVCVQVGMLGQGVVEYVCPAGSKYSTNHLKCITPATQKAELTEAEAER